METHFSLPHKRAEEGTEIEKTHAAPSRFPSAFKRLRLERRWRQEDLANALHVTLRAVVSWETGERIPSPGMVFLLCTLLTDHQGTTADLLAHEVSVSYLMDDLVRQIQIRPDEAFHKQASQGIERLQERYQPEPEQVPLTLSLEQPGQATQQQRPWRPDEAEQVPGDVLQQLFALLDQLRQHPELIRVVSDFLRELGPDG
jgi:transcriptional regulator with XRE-family HTH domain